MEDDARGFDVVDGVGGAPVAIAGLADGAGIDEVPGLGGEVEDPVFLVIAGVVAGTDVDPLVLALGEAALDVGVAEEGERA